MKNDERKPWVPDRLLPNAIEPEISEYLAGGFDLGYLQELRGHEGLTARGRKNVDTLIRCIDEVNYILFNLSETSE
jgi:hypothetical protein